MLLRYLYDSNLAQASYLVGCQRTGEALVVDPNREIELYLSVAEREGLRITAVSETHIHADFVSGARELSERVGAILYLSDEGGSDWCYRFPHTGLRHGDRFAVGNVRLTALHTPGHTPEHLAFLLTDAANADEPMGLFSGDFLFVGDIGRPDLLESAAGVAGSREPAARALFSSLQEIRSLPDYLQIWPGHGAGSACGKALGAVPSTTLGYERRFNWAFQTQDEQQFVERVLEGQPEPPRYFAQMKRVNRDGPTDRTEASSLERLTSADFSRLLASGAFIVDTRPWEEFAAAHLPGTLSIPFCAGFANWAGSVLPYDQPLYFVVDAPLEAPLLKELARVGLDNVAGLAHMGVLANLRDTLEPFPQATILEFADRLAAGNSHALDVRRSAEHEEGSIGGVMNLPVQRLVDEIDRVPRDGPVYIHCQSGTRSALAASYLRSRRGVDAINVPAGMDGWREAHLPIQGGESERSLQVATSKVNQ